MHSSPHLNIRQFNTQCLTAITGVFLISGFAACATIPSKYVNQAQLGVTLTQLTKHPDAYAGKVMILGGAIVEKKEEDGHTWLLVRNRPLDVDYVPHIAASLGGSEDGHYWVVVTKGLPKAYTHWARLTVVGRVADQRVAGPITSTEVRPILMSLYLRGWDSGFGGYGVHESKWEEIQSPNAILSEPRPVMKKE